KKRTPAAPLNTYPKMENQHDDAAFAEHLNRLRVDTNIPCSWAISLAQKEKGITMLRKLFAVMLMMGLLTMMPAGSMAQETASPSQPAAHKKGGEHHSKIRHAIKALQAAKDDLEDASHDFGGHRAEALEAVNNAIKQLQEALQYDKK